MENNQHVTFSPSDALAP